MASVWEEEVGVSISKLTDLEGLDCEWLPSWGGPGTAASAPVSGMISHVRWDSRRTWRERSDLKSRHIFFFSIGGVWGG